MLGAAAGPRAQVAGGGGMRPIGRMGQSGFGPSGVPYGTTGGYYARGSRGRSGG